MGMRSNDRYRGLAPGSWIGGLADTVQFNGSTGSVHGKPHVACQILPTYAYYMQVVVLARRVEEHSFRVQGGLASAIVWGPTG
ncbi:hypothetical protein CH63R_12949 [Colletotrichum higginsianum IMI 349063]|uniref:Uncharacterized protein n=1 Tax=Colletotrichum higginsianum (strain IMI 349063) TaxID=759273 RepID=A0A1B7XVK5_COLHI|nr:hypothetical protein CH63R_12949 [Colletotrichum higginsianum IMI 349063]OBR03822.1 hypothetical protein CH63R_12949 [Colletotrichum higginsianum IMI 349063]GJD01847.1 hypothetical protein ColKHC_10672 [Colletotrichum higginsianum]